jgi:exopolysaccharide biosynthesis polyprenyl glycosylphosphotransferase
VRPITASLIFCCIVVGTGVWFYSSIPFIGSYILSLAILPVLKKLMALLVARSEPDKNLVCSVIIAGADGPAQDLSRKIDRHPEWGIRVAGFLSVNKPDADPSLSNHPILGTVDDIGRVLGRVIVDMILVAPEKGISRHVDGIIQRCRLEGVDIGFVTDLPLPESTMTVIEQLEDLRLWIIRSVRREPEKLFLKRAIDLVASVAIFFLTLPVWIIVPFFIRMDSPGPVLFRQTRMGKNGRQFTMFKFRSMVPDAEHQRYRLMHLNEMDGPVFKMKDDPRVTKIGSFLRNTSLDELPQLFNVIKGDISLVGPRPPLIEEVQQYRPWEKKRLSVLQGITGLWQISGRNEIKFDEWMKLDLMYIDQWRFSLDMLILLKTLPAVVARKGAQ